MNKLAMRPYVAVFVAIFLGGIVFSPTFLPLKNGRKEAGKS